MSCLVNAFKSIQNIYNSWFYPVEPPKIEEKIMVIHFKDSKYDSDTAYLGRCYACNVPYEGKTYPNVEAAFQAAICEDKRHRDTFARLALYRENEYDYKLSPLQKDLLKQKAITDRIGYVAKFLGNSLPVKKTTDLETRNQILEDIVFSKFNNDPTLRQKLLDTEDAQLIEEGEERRTGIDYRYMLSSDKRALYKNHGNLLEKALMSVRNRISKGEYLSLTVSSLEECWERQERRKFSKKQSIE
ncbi:MAG: hypothetical protein KR126chlam6_00021 [Candidatus Anoxychlamydiales bacterium]|nr:hypothetical protein [Candidatus Anoxychlamydiales bacterium]